MSRPESTKAMDNPPEGDPKAIPQGDFSPQLRGYGAPEQLVITFMGSAAKLAGNWVGVSVQVVCSGLGVIPSTSVVLPWHTWQDLYRGDLALKAFKTAAHEGWITISNSGYAYPTQKLADLVCELEK